MQIFESKPNFERSLNRLYFNDFIELSSILAMLEFRIRTRFGINICIQTDFDQKTQKIIQNTAYRFFLEAKKYRSSIVIIFVLATNFGNVSDGKEGIFLNKL